MADNSNDQGRLLLKESDFVDIVNEDGNVVGSVPKHWRHDDLPPGTSKKSGRAAKASGGSESGSGSGSSGDKAGDKAGPSA